MAERLQTTIRPSRALRRLADVTSRQCRGRTLVVAEEAADLIQACEAQGVEALPAGVRELDSMSSFDPPPRTVVLDRQLHRLSRETAGELLRRIWSTLPSGGRLVVVVPQRGGGADQDAVVSYSRRDLRRLLRPLARPRLITSQPYRWLLMVVDRPRAGSRPVRRVLRDRFAATVKQCRGRVLELGCGTGQLSHSIAAAGHEVTGVDLNREKIEQARRDHPGLEFHRGDILEVDLPGSSFDTVVLAEVLEHVPAEVGDRMIDRAWHWLRPAGRLIVSVPNEDLVPHHNHVREFDRHGLRRHLERWGRTRTVTDQPFKWLMMVTEKEA